MLVEEKIMPEKPGCDCVFKIINKNNDEGISEKEFLKAVKRFGDPTPEAELKEAFKNNIDADGSGKANE